MVIIIIIAIIITPTLLDELPPQLVRVRSGRGYRGDSTPWENWKRRFKDQTQSERGSSPFDMTDVELYKGIKTWKLNTVGCKVGRQMRQRRVRVLLPEIRTFLSKQKMPTMKKPDVPWCCQKRKQWRRRWICFAFDQVLLIFYSFPTSHPSPSLLHIFFFLFSFFSHWCWLQQNPAACWWWWWWWWWWSTCRPPPDKEHSGKTNSEDGHLNILLTYWWICESAHIKIKI